MASIPHFYSDYPFSSDEFSEFSSVMAQDHRYARTGSFSSTIVSNGAISGSSGGAMLGDHQDHNFPTFYDHKHGYALNLCEGESEIMSPSPGMNSLPDQRFGIADMVVPTLMDYKMGSNCGIAKFQNFGGGYQLSDVCEYGEDCCGILPKFTPVMCPAAEENWRLEYNPITAKENTNMVKVGRYTVEERKDRILRYLKKRNQRNFNKTIKYACRKTLADRRVRVRGRFARNNETFEEETEVKKNDDNIPHHRHEKDTYCTSDAVQIKNDEEDEEQWLQEALASLMYVPPPYIAG
ncbi:ZINC FINGER PROTEIN CONSTANS-LIKE 10 [Salix purpurea]|uniref:ZINC FINGER PROTEIN CONSTANS-LIKE 10 n=1 Tax=Salix purpurea TaxID=77065 RepID=A0A9Q0WWH0_SALPP|nr:ZINC FINGER PROTEIN CONSTANS-LIKE 10 [Salix purpurea]